MAKARKRLALATALSMGAISASFLADYRAWRDRPGAHPRQRKLVCVFEGVGT